MFFRKYWNKWKRALSKLSLIAHSVYNWATKPCCRIVLNNYEQNCQGFYVFWDSISLFSNKTTPCFEARSNFWNLLCESSTSVALKPRRRLGHRLKQDAMPNGDFNYTHRLSIYLSAFVSFYYSSRRLMLDIWTQHKQISSVPDQICSLTLMCSCYTQSRCTTHTTHHPGKRRVL